MNRSSVTLALLALLALAPLATAQAEDDFDWGDDPFASFDDPFADLEANVTDAEGALREEVAEATTKEEGTAEEPAPAAPAAAADDATAEPAAEPETKKGTPGFGLIAALGAMGASGLALRRRN